MIRDKREMKQKAWTTYHGYNGSGNVRPVRIADCHRKGREGQQPLPRLQPKGRAVLRPSIRGGRGGGEGGGGGLDIATGGGVHADGVAGQRGGGGEGEEKGGAFGAEGVADGAGWGLSGAGEWTTGCPGE